MANCFCRSLRRRTCARKGRSRVRFSFRETWSAKQHDAWRLEKRCAKWQKRERARAGFKLRCAYNFHGVECARALSSSVASQRCICFVSLINARNEIRSTQRGRSEVQQTMGAQWACRFLRKRVTLFDRKSTEKERGRAFQLILASVTA